MSRRRRVCVGLADDHKGELMNWRFSWDLYCRFLSSLITDPSEVVLPVRCVSHLPRVSRPIPRAHFRAKAIFRKHSLPSPRIWRTKSAPLTLPRSTPFCRTYIASRHAASSAHRFQSWLATIVGAIRTSSIGGCFFDFAVEIV